MSISLINKERFVPSRLSNLAVWLDGADSNTISLSGSTTQVTRWADKSGNATDFFVQPVPPPVVPPMQVVTRTIPGSDSYTTSPLYSSTVSVTLSGAGGGAGAGGGGLGGLAMYTFTNVAPNTTIQYTVSSAGISGNTPGGGGSTTLSINSNTITAGGGGSGIKVIQGNPALAPFGGTPTTDASAGFFYTPTPTTIVVAQPPAGFSYTAGGGSPPTADGSIIVSPASSNFSNVGSASFTLPVSIGSATITLNGAGGGGVGGGSGGRVVYTGSMPQGNYTWYVGGTGSGYTGGTGYRSGSDGPFVNGATGAYGGAPNGPGDAGFVAGENTRQDVQGFTHTVGGGAEVSTDGSITIDVPPVSSITYSDPSTVPKTWTSPTYQSVVTIVLTGAGGGGGSSGNPGSGGNNGGNGGKVSLVLTGVPPETQFTYIVGSGGGGSQDLTPQTPSADRLLFGDVPKDNTVGLLGGDVPKDNTVGLLGGGATPQTNIGPGTPGEPGSGVARGNGAGGGGYSSVSYFDPEVRGLVTLVVGGGGGGAGYPYFSGGQPVDGMDGGSGGQTDSTLVGGSGGTLSGPQNSIAGPGSSGSGDWDLGIRGTGWNPILTLGLSNTNGGTAGDPATGNNSGGNGGNGNVTFSAVGDGRPASFQISGIFTYNPSVTSTYILTVKGAGGGGGKGGQGIYTSILSNGTSYTCIVGAGGLGGLAGGQSSVNNFPIFSNTYTLVAGGGGGGGVNGNGGGGSSALQFPSGDVLVGGGGGGASPGGAGGGDASGKSGGSANGGNGRGFASTDLLPFSAITTGGGSSSNFPGSITISYAPTTITTTVPGTFTTQVAGRCTFTVNGAGGGGNPGGQGVYTRDVASGVKLAYQVGQGGSGANSGAGTFLSPFVLPDGSAFLKAGGGGGSNNIQDVGVAGESAYGGSGGIPGVNGGKGGPGTGGGNPSGVISTAGGGSSGNGSVYFTVTYTSPTVSPSLTTYTNPGVLFPSGYMAVSSKLAGLGSAKTLMAVYQCSGAGASMNIGLGTNVSGGSFGISQTGGTLYSPYQYGNGYDLTFTPAIYTAKSYAFASYGTAPYTITGMSGFDDTTMKAAAFESLVVDSSLIVGRQLVGYPSEDFILYELIATSNALSASDRQEVEGYLAFKWGLTLPVGHPYKNFQPSGDQWIPIGLPTTVSGLVSWLDMTISGQTGKNIADSVGGSFLLRGVPLTLSNINNHPSLYFPGTGYNFLQRNGSFPSVGSALFVFSISDDRSSLPIIAFGGSPVLTYTAPSISIGNNDGFTISDQSPMSVSLNSGPNLVFFAWELSNYYLSANGGPPVVGSYASPTSSSSFFIGGNFGGGSIIPTMNFGELVVYSQYFEQAERQLLEGYLAWKWNIERKLPSSHPYAKESPIGATVTEVSPLNIPGQIPSLVTWLDAADSETFTMIGSNAVWYDKSATSDVFGKFEANLAPTYTTTPTQSGPPLPGVHFSSNCSLVGKTDASIVNGTGSCFLVATVLGNAQVLAGGFQTGTVIEGNSFGFYMQSSNAVSPIQGWQNYYMNTFVNTATSGPRVFFGQINAGLRGAEAQGSFQFSTPPSSQGTNKEFLQGYTPIKQSPWILGTATGSPVTQNFYVHEFLCFSDYFNDTQRQLIEGYLAWKWGVQSQLPQGHPYSNARPQSA